MLTILIPALGLQILNVFTYKYIIMYLEAKWNKIRNLWLFNLVGSLTFWHFNTICGTWTRCWYSILWLFNHNMIKHPARLVWRLTDLVDEFQLAFNIISIVIFPFLCLRSVADLWGLFFLPAPQQSWKKLSNVLPRVGGYKYLFELV